MKKKWRIVLHWEFTRDKATRKIGNDMNFSNEELMDMVSPSCPECRGKHFARAGDTYVGRCIECKTLVESFGVVPQLAAQLLEQKNYASTFTDEEAVERILNRYSRELASNYENGHLYAAEELIKMSVKKYLENIAF
jgi:hypothetical protein